MAAIPPNIAQDSAADSSLARRFKVEPRGPRAPARPADYPFLHPSPDVDPFSTCPLGHCTDSAFVRNQGMLTASAVVTKDMKAAPARKPVIHIAVVDSDPLRFIGLRSLFDEEPDLDLIAATLEELPKLENVDLILLGNRGSGTASVFDVMASLKAARPDLRIIVTGTGADDESILKALAAGAKGYVDEGASPSEFVQAIRIVNQGSVWAPRRVMSIFIDRVTSSPGKIFPAGRVEFTEREKEVLALLVAGRSNREIGQSLQIEERTVKAHVAKLMRKVGVQNRIALSVHAITHSLVGAEEEPQ